jgi:hypothetical protein
MRPKRSSSAFARPYPRHCSGPKTNRKKNARVRCRPDVAAFYCLQRQAVRFEGLR